MDSANSLALRELFSFDDTPGLEFLRSEGARGVRRHESGWPHFVGEILSDVGGVGMKVPIW